MRARSIAGRGLDRAFAPLGFNVTMRHFYSPIPERGARDQTFWEEPSSLPGLSLDPAAHMAFLERELAPFLAEFRPPPRATGRPYEFFLRNGLYQGVDAEVLYAMIRFSHPKRIIELGAGYSTLVIAAACDANRRQGHAATFLSYDPYASAPPTGEVPELSALRPVAAEAVPLEDFAALAANDVLFIDSSHVVKVGGDVIFLLLEVLPRLAPGVLVHFHDVFLPWQYPRSWVEHNRWYWTEQYLLQALLVGNPGFESVFAAYAVSRACPERLKAAVPSFDEATPPLSYWLRTSVGAA